jgi:hypothetical protein
MLTGLKLKHQRFIEEYARDWNATAAYRRAGYRATGHSAEANASRLMRRPDVAAAVKALSEQQRAEIQARGPDRSDRPSAEPLKRADAFDTTHTNMAPPKGHPGAEPADYPHQVPRHVHKAGGVSKIVYTPQECERALKVDGWELLPPQANRNAEVC